MALWHIGLSCLFWHWYSTGTLLCVPSMVQFLDNMPGKPTQVLEQHASERTGQNSCPSHGQLGTFGEWTHEWKIPFLLCVSLLPYNSSTQINMLILYHTKTNGHSCFSIDFICKTTWEIELTCNILWEPLSFRTPDCISITSRHWLKNTRKFLLLHIHLGTYFFSYSLCLFILVLESRHPVSEEYVSIPSSCYNKFTVNT